MEDKINVGDYIIIKPDCCDFGVKGVCEVCYFEWENCICGAIDDLCSCGRQPKILKDLEKSRRAEEER